MRRPLLRLFGKGAGENTNAPTPAAIRNALYDATGIWFNDLPITPDKIITCDARENERGEIDAL